MIHARKASCLAAAVLLLAPALRAGEAAPPKPAEADLEARVKQLEKRVQELETALAKQRGTRKDDWGEWLQRRGFGNQDDIMDRLREEMQRDLGGDLNWWPGPRAAAPANKPRLGVELAAPTDELRERFRNNVQQGAFVMSVVPGSPAEKAGLAVGDAITSFGAQMIVAPQDLIAAVKAAPQGKTDIVVIRRGESLNLKVDLGEAAVEAGDNAVQPRDGWLRRGDKVPGQAAQPQVDVKASALQLTDELAKELKLTDEQRKKMADVLAKHTQELTQEAALKSEKSARRRGGITLNLSADVSTLVDKHVADAEKELAGTLSPEQIKQWAAYRKTHNRLSVTQSMKAESVVGDDAGGGGEDMGF